jgi:hypothetical protein
MPRLSAFREFRSLRLHVCYANEDLNTKIPKRKTNAWGLGYEATSN